MIIRIIINGKWKSPGHSDKGKDDTHIFKKKLLKEIAKHLSGRKLKPYYKTVGNNPDLGIDKKTGKIKLKGTDSGPFPGKELDTEIDADEFFILFILSPPTPTASKEVSVDDIDIAHHFVIPPSIEIVSGLVDYLEENNINENVLLEITI